MEYKTLIEVDMEVLRSMMETISSLKVQIIQLEEMVKKMRRELYNVK